jgi:hypothetical protein
MVGIMKFAWLAMGIIPAFVAPVLWAQNRRSSAAEADGHGRLTRVVPPATDDADQSPAFDRDAWRKRLTQSDLDQRMRDFDELANRARRDKAAREALESWAHDTSNADLSWTSRLVLREADALRQHGGGFGWKAFGGPPAWGDLQARLDELQQQFGGMDSMFGDLQAELDQMQRNPKLLVPATPNGSKGSSSFENFTLQVGPDGVTCKVHENVDGQEQTKEYKADSLEALLEAHPELRERIQAGEGGFGWTGPLFSGGMGRGPGGGSARSGLDRLARPLSGAPPTDIFGIEFTKLPPQKLKDLNLEPERGLNVQRTVPGTIAQILGVKRGDLLIEMNGTPLFSGDDVSRVLRERAPDAELVVTLIDGKGQRRTLTWKPSAAGAQEKPQEKPARRGSSPNADEDQER